MDHLLSQGVNGDTLGNEQSKKRIEPRTGLSAAPRVTQWIEYYPSEPKLEWGGDIFHLL